MIYYSRQSSICVWHLDSLFVCLNMIYDAITEGVFPLQAHGYATEEFEVTVERLGVYLPVCILSDTTSEVPHFFHYLDGTHRQPQGLW